MSDREAEKVEAEASDAAVAPEEIDQPEEADSAGQGRFARKWSKRSTSPNAGPQERDVVVADPVEELQKERARANDLYERLQRSMADLSNYRKRQEADREEMAKFASMLLVADLLPVLDNFERALTTIPQELEMFSWLQGIALIERHLRAILERQGVEVIEAKGAKFNPTLHEAIVEEESSEAEPGTVLEELQRGYTMHGRVIRPTLAKVAKAAGAASVAAEDEPAGTADSEAGALADEEGSDHGSESG